MYVSYKNLTKVYYQNKDEYDSLYEKRIKSENTKMLNLKINDNAAFYCLCPDIYDLSFKIMELDKKVQVIKASLPGVALNQFANKCLIDEIMLSNDIEGVYSTRKEIKIIVDEHTEEHPKKDRRFYGLVTKYLMLGRNKIELENCDDIRKIYDELVLPEIIAEDAEKAPDGRIFRKDLAEVTTATQKVIHKGLYPEEKIIDYMDSSLKLLKDEDIPVLIRISIFHYLFGYIHPFYDGNGRTSRFISSYLLSDYFDDLIGFRLSYTIKENISEYYEAFRICNDAKNKGDVTPFIITFLNIIYKAFEKLYEALYDRKTLLDQTLKDIAKLELFEDDEVLLLCSYLVQAALFSKDGISKSELSVLLDVSETTLRKRLSIIKQKGFLTEKRVGQFKYFAFDVHRLNDDIN